MRSQNFSKRHPNAWGLLITGLLLVFLIELADLNSRFTWAQTVYGIVKGSEFRVISATDPRLTFQTTDGGTVLGSITLRTADNFGVTYALTGAGTETLIGTQTWFKIDASGNVIEIGESGLGATISLLGSFEGYAGQFHGTSTYDGAATGNAIQLEDTGDSNFKTWYIQPRYGTMGWGTNSTGIDVELQRDTAGTLRMSLGDMDFDSNLTVDGEFSGARAYLQFGTSDNITASRYLCWGVVTSSTCSWTAPVSGSVVSLSGGCQMSLASGSPTVTMGVRKNAGGTPLIVHSLSTASGWNENQTVQGRNTSGDTFSSGDNLNCFITVSGTVTASYCQCSVGVQLDS